MAKRIDPETEMLIMEFEGGLYGELMIKYEAGRAVLYKRSETIKPSRLSIKEGDKDVEMLGANK